MPVTAVRDEGALRMWVCRLPVHIGPAECTRFYGTLRRIRICQMGRQSRRPLQRHSLFTVEADDSVRPAEYTVFTKLFGEFVIAHRVDVGISPYNQAGKCIRIRRGFSMIQCILRAEQSPAPTNIAQNLPLPAWKSNRRLV